MKAALALGSNRGDRQAFLDGAIAGLRARARLLALSSVHETNPVGGPPGQGPYLNQVVILEWEGTPEELLSLARSLEAAAGRERTERWGARTLDVDILLLGAIERGGDELTLPHPRLHERRFVLLPLAEVASDWLVPGAGRRVGELLADLALPR